MQLQHAGSAAKYRNICRSEEREMHERGVVKRDTLHKRRKCTEHGHGKRDAVRLLRSLICVAGISGTVSVLRCTERVNETFTPAGTIRSVSLLRPKNGRKTSEVQTGC